MKTNEKRTFETRIRIEKQSRQNEIIARTLTSRKKRQEKYSKKVEKRIVETRIRFENQSKLSEMAANTLTSRDNTGPGGVAIVPTLPRHLKKNGMLNFCSFFFTYESQWLNSPRYACSQGRIYNKVRMKRTERSTILGAN